MDSERDEHDSNAEEINDGKFDGDKNYEESCYDLFLLLNSIKANLNNIASNSSEVNDKINELEMESYDLLKPMGDVLSLERELQQLNDIESNFKSILKENNKM